MLVYEAPNTMNNTTRTLNELLNGELARLIANQAYSTGQKPEKILDILVNSTKHQLKKYNPPKLPSSFYKAPEVGNISKQDFIVQTEREWRKAQIMKEARLSGIKIHPKTAHYIANSDLDDGTSITEVFKPFSKKRRLLPAINKSKKRRRVTFANPISTYES